MNAHIFVPKGASQTKALKFDLDFKLLPCN